MSEPTKIPTWATETSLLQDPGVAKQASGWAGEIPPVQYFNWWMNLVGQWIFYFRNQLSPPCGSWLFAFSLPVYVYSAFII